jgi:hypothetical protein
MNRLKMEGPALWLSLLGLALLLYAVVGNYVALPGYIRFLERGGKSEAGASFDASVLFGAIRTVAWMYSFQLGVLLLVVAKSIRERLHTKQIVVFSLFWLVAWSWPSLPAPGAWFYIVFGGAVLVCVVAALAQSTSSGVSKSSRTLFLASLAFFAFATWEVCGLGSTGRMLHPDQAARPLANGILVTQSSKLMFEFLFAWGLLVASSLLSRRDLHTAS